MPVAKVRCTACRKYVSPDSLYRSSSLVNVCSQECFYRMHDRVTKARTTSFSSRSDNGVPPATRAEVVQRDNGRCRYCRCRRSHMHVHHIIYKSQGVDHSVHNLITLCEEHHRLVHSNKRLFQPLLLGLIWMDYVEGKRLTLPQFKRWLNVEEG